jgi:hypothetical protein
MAQGASNPNIFGVGWLVVAAHRYLAKQLPGISSHRFPAGCGVQASTYEEALNDAAYAL